MTTAAHTSGLRLLDFARWLVTLLVVHFVIARGRQLAAALHKPSGPDDAFLAHHFGTTDRDQILARLTDALRRAAALEDDVLARRPIEKGFSIETRRAFAAQITDICRALGFFRAKSTRVPSAPPPLVEGAEGEGEGEGEGGGGVPIIFPSLAASATGPPALSLRGGAAGART